MMIISFEGIENLFIINFAINTTIGLLTIKTCFNFIFYSVSIFFKIKNHIFNLKFLKLRYVIELP